MTNDWMSAGVRLYPAVVTSEHIAGLRDQADAWLRGRPGRRLQPDDWKRVPIAIRLTMTEIAGALIGPGARPVRILVFDKTPQINWSVAWHQDRVVAVQTRADVPGFGPWSTKDGVPHVEPPVAILERMVTLRLHLDDCGADSAPLKLAQGSHRLGLVPADRAADEAGALPMTICTAKAGDVWASSSLVLHASERSCAAGHRRVLHIDFAAIDLPPPLRWLGYG
jgi:hypothetical protein